MHCYYNLSYDKNTLKKPAVNRSFTDPVTGSQTMGFTGMHEITAVYCKKWSGIRDMGIMTLILVSSWIKIFHSKDSKWI